MYEYPTFDIDVYDETDLGLLGVIISGFIYMLSCESVVRVLMVQLWYWVSDIDYFKSHIIQGCSTVYFDLVPIDLSWSRG